MIAIPDERTLPPTRLGIVPSPGKEGHMYVVAIHSISDPEAFWGGQLDLPNGTELPVVAPSSDGTRGVCIFKSDSVNTVQRLVDGATSKVSRNEFYALNEGSALGLPD
ncbi:MAG: hypothetical protein E6G60_12455 [Actinobacteria bacterium]|nr:MAG: hypothetical protein E6G60_12455 [Actinomycetota bacterium]